MKLLQQNSFSLKLSWKRSPREWFRGDIAMMAGSVFALMVIIVATYLFAEIQSITPFTHWVSNLGIGPNGSSDTFNIGLKITGILYLIMGIYFVFTFYGISREINYFLAIILTTSIISVIGIFILTDNVMGTTSPKHAIGACMFFIGTPFFTGFSTGLFHMLGKTTKSQRIITYLHVGLSISIVPLMLYFKSTILGSQGNVLNSMEPGFFLVRLNEWIAVLTFFLWIFQTGILFYQFKNFQNISKQF